MKDLLSGITGTTRKFSSCFSCGHKLWTKKLTASGLVLCLAWFTCVPAAWSQSSPNVGNIGASSIPPIPQSQEQSKSEHTAPLPAPSAKQSAKARELFRKGTAALEARKSAKAIKLFSEAHKLEPANSAYLAAYEIARQQQIGGMLQAARKSQESGNSKSAKENLLNALSVDPENPYVRQHLQAFDVEKQHAVVQSRPMPQFSTGLVDLAPTSVRATFHVRGSAQQIVKDIFDAYGIKAVLDDSVPTQSIRIDLTDASFPQASTAVQLATGTFIVPLDAQHALVARDTKENRDKFERLLLESVYLPGVPAKQMNEPLNVVKNVFGVKQASVNADNGTLTIRAPEATLRAANAMLVHLYGGKPQVMLDLRVYQIDDTRQQQLGVSFPQTLNVFNVTSELTEIINANQSTVAELIAGGLVNPGDMAGIAALLVGLGLVNGTVLNQPFALFGNGLTLSGLSFGGTTVNASLNISNTRQLDHMQLLAEDSQKQSFLIGSRYPVVTQSYSSGTQIPTSSTSLSSLVNGNPQATTGASDPLSFAPTVQYENLGLTVKAIPHVSQGNDVQIQLEVTIASLAGASVNDSPIINNRSFETTIQVRDGGSAMITSNVSSTESKSISGIPGLSELPGFAWTASPTTNVAVGKLLIVLSPHIISETHPGVASQMVLLSPKAPSR